MGLASALGTLAFLPFPFQHAQHRPDVAHGMGPDLPHRPAEHARELRYPVGGSVGFSVSASSSSPIVTDSVISRTVMRPTVSGGTPVTSE